MNNTFIAAKNFVLDVLFPKHCIFCDFEGEFVCHACFSKATLQPVNTDQDFIVASSYHDRYVQEMIHYLKYRYVTDLAQPLANILIALLQRKFQASFFDPEKIFLVPVPLFKKKYNLRGFNQSELIANIVGSQLGIQVIPALQKTKNTPAQMTITQKNTRLTNLHNAFQCIMPERVKGKEILLIDDVVTTGATMEECAKTLKKSGAKKVWKAAVAG